MSKTTRTAVPAMGDKAKSIGTKITLLMRHQVDLDENLGELIGVDCGDFDLEPKLVSADMYISPSSDEEVEKIFKTPSPWEHDPFSRGEFGNYHAALELCRNLRDALYVWDPPKFHMRNCDFEKGEELSYLRNGCSFAVCEEVIEAQDSNLPHISTLLACESLMEERYLSWAEIWAILVLSKSRRMWKDEKGVAKYEADRIIPVTIFSASSWKARIVHAYLDPKSGRIKAKKSRIIDLEAQPQQKTLEWWLSWMSGTPSGNTK